MKKNYYIGTFKKNGDDKVMDNMPCWYGISEEMMIGICLGMKLADNRKTIEIRAYELDNNGNRVKLARVQH